MELEGIIKLSVQEEQNRSDIVKALSREGYFVRETYYKNTMSSFSTNTQYFIEICIEPQDEAYYFKNEEEDGDENYWQP